VNNGSFSTGGQPQNPSFGTVVVTAALQLNAGAVFELFNTADKTTNYERLRADWLANVAQIWTGFGGSASNRTLRLGHGSTIGGTGPTRYIDVTGAGVSVQASTSTAGGVVFGIGEGNILGSTSGIQTALSVTPTINQSGTAGYTALDINPTETSTGSGTKLLQRWAVGGTAVGQLNSGGGFWANALFSVGTVQFSVAGLGVGGDIILNRDTADTLALRRTTNVQTFRGYETYTDASNYSRWYQTFSGGFAYYGTQAAGTGTRRPLIVQHFTTPLAALPTAATAGAGSRAVISDATAPVFGAAVVGGGAVVSPVYSDGANWIVG